MWLDGTAQYASILLPPQMDRGAKVVVVKPEGAEVKTIPFAAPRDQGVDQTWDVKVAADGSAVATGEFRARGDSATQIRSHFSVEGQRALKIQELLAVAFGKAELVSQDFEDLKDLSKPEVGFRVVVKVPGFAKPAGEARMLPSRFLDSSGGLAASWIDRAQREHDLLINPSSSRTKITYRLPEGWSVETAPQDTSVSNPAFVYTSTAHADGTTLVLDREIQVLAPRVSRSDYAGFREAVTKAVSAATQSWKVKRAPPPAPAPTPAPAAPGEAKPGEVKPGEGK
jgi:hypothetical protein